MFQRVAAGLSPEPEEEAGSEEDENRPGLRTVRKIKPGLGGA